jgi:hypothetical protein
VGIFALEIASNVTWGVFMLDAKKNVENAIFVAIIAILDAQLPAHHAKNHAKIIANMDHAQKLADIRANHASCPVSTNALIPSAP